MRFLLYKPGTNDGSEGETASPGMGIVARSIKQAGHSVTVVDGELTPGLSTPDYKRFDVIGLSAVSLEATQAEAIRKSVQSLNRPVWIGGPHALSYYDLMGEYDKIVVGDADGCIEQILNSLDRVMFPVVSELLAPDYSSVVGNQNMIAYSTYISRGCTNGCSFCASNGKLRGGIRVRSMDSIKDEFKEIQRYPNVKSINMIDDSFSADLEHAKQFLDWYVSKQFPYKMNVFNVRADQIDMELLQLLKRAGQHHLPIGVESGCEEVFNFIGKGEKLSDIENAIKMIHESGIIPWLNMIVGLPKDNPDNHNKSVLWARQFAGYSIIHWFQYAPYRRTRAYDWFVKNGQIEDGFIPNTSYGANYQDIPWKPCFENPDFTIEEREAAQLYGFLTGERRIAFNDLGRVQDLCMKYGLMKLLEVWYVRKPAFAYYYRKDDGEAGSLASVVVPAQRAGG